MTNLARVRPIAARAPSDRLVLAVLAVILLTCGAASQELDRRASRNVADTQRFPDGMVVVNVSDGSKVHGTTRRQVLDRLFVERGIEIEWRDEAFADEPVHGRFSGTENEAIKTLLGRSNYVIVYDTSGDGPRTSRIVVIGPSSRPVAGVQAATTSRRLPAARLKASRPEQGASRQAVKAYRRAVQVSRRKPRR